MVWNDEKLQQKDKALKNNADRLYFEEISVHLSKINEELLILHEYVYHLGQ